MEINKTDSQGLLLFDQPLSRRTDPETSFEAAKRLKKSGHWSGQKRAVFQALRQNNGSTSAELAKAMGEDRYIPSRRLKELESLGLVRRGMIRMCTVCGNRCLTWYVVDEDRFF